jgi:hypothetical protein
MSGPSSSGKKLAFWELSKEMEDHEDPEFQPRDEEMDEAAEETADEEMMEDAEDATTTDGGSSASKKRKDRTPNMVNVTTRSIVTSVNAQGEPEAPEKVVAGFSNQIGAILRSTVSVNTENLKSPANRGLLVQLFRKLHARYAFPGDEENKYNNDEYKGNPVNSNALKKMNKALGNWKARVKRLITDDKLSYPEFAKKEPLISEDDYNTFKARCATVTSQVKSRKGKELRAKNIGTHHLGSGGYRAAVPKWDKQDADCLAKGVPPPFADIKDQQARNFFRARHSKPKGADYSLEPTGPFAEKVKDLRRNYVSSFPCNPRFFAFTTNQ